MFAHLYFWVTQVSASYKFQATTHTDWDALADPNYVRQACDTISVCGARKQLRAARG